MKKRIISLLLSALMLTPSMPFVNIAAADAPASRSIMAVGEKYELTAASELVSEGDRRIDYLDAESYLQVPGGNTDYPIGTTLTLTVPTYTKVEVTLTIKIDDDTVESAGIRNQYIYYQTTSSYVGQTVKKGETYYITTEQISTIGRGYGYVRLITQTMPAPSYKILAVEVKDVNKNTSFVYDFSTPEKTPTVADYNGGFPHSFVQNPERAYIGAAASGTETSVCYSPNASAVTLEEGIYKVSGQFRPAANCAIDVSVPGVDDAVFSVDAASGQWNTLEKYVAVTEPTAFEGVMIDGGNGAYEITELSFERVSAFEDAVLHNLISDGDCDLGIPEGLTDSGDYELRWDGHGYVVASARAEGNMPVVYTPNVVGGADASHTYLLSFRIRTSVDGATTAVRLATFNNSFVYPMLDEYTTSSSYYLNVNDEWQTVTFKISPTTNAHMLRNKQIRLQIHGGPGGNAEYQLDGFTLIDVTDVTGTGYENLITDGHCTNGIPEGMEDGLGALVHHEDGYVITPDRAGNGVSTFAYTTSVEGGLDPTHTYRLSFSLRSGEPYANSTFRFYDVRRGAVTPVGYANNVVGITSEWKTYSIEVSPETNPTLMNIKQITVLIAGYMGNPGIFHIDDLKLIDITPTEADIPNKNLIENGTFNEGTDADAVLGWSDELAGARITTEYVTDNRVIAVSSRDVSDKAVKFEQDIALEKGHTYRLLFKVRMQDKTAVDTISLYTSLGGSTIAAVVPRDNTQHAVNVSGEWQTVIVEINEKQNSAFFDADKFNICFYGSEDGTGFGALFLDDFVLIDTTPSDLGMPHIGIIMLLLKKRSGEWTEPEVRPGENEVEVVYTNLIEDADSAEGISKWATNGQTLESKTEGNTTYVAASGITTNYVGFTYKSGVTLQPGNYKFSCKVRTSVKGEESTVRAYNPVDNSATFLGIDNSWKELSFDMTVTAPIEFTLKICGGMQADFIQSYDISEITLVNLNQGATQSGAQTAGNLISGATSAAALGSWTTSGQTLEAKKEGKTDYLAASGITTNYVGFTYKSGVTLQPGNYEFSCKVRTSVKGDTTSLRAVNLLDNMQTFVSVNNSWTEIKYAFTVSAAGEFSVRICGGMNAEFVQPYDISDMKLTKLG